MSSLRILRPAFLRLSFPPSTHNSPTRRSLAMAPSDWIPVPQHGSIPPYLLFTKAIEKSNLDQRQYRLIRLDNDLTAVLVHDPHTENAAASLDVAVGHLSDPVRSTHSQSLITCS